MINTGKCIVMDLDGTLCPVKGPGEDYADLQPYEDVLQRLRELFAEGWYVILSTSRNMASFEGNIGLINARTLPVLLRWLDEHDVPFDELHVGKPWAGRSGFYVDDRAIRPAEFLQLSVQEVEQLIERDRCKPA